MKGTYLDDLGSTVWRIMYMYIWYDLIHEHLNERWRLVQWLWYYLLWLLRKSWLSWYIDVYESFYNKAHNKNKNKKTTVQGILDTHTNPVIKSRYTRDTWKALNIPQSVASCLDNRVLINTAKRYTITECSKYAPTLGRLRCLRLRSSTSP